MIKRFYSTASAANLCQVSRGSVLRWIREGQLKAGTTMGGHHRIQPADLLELLQKLDIPIPPEVNSYPAVETPKKILIVEDDPDICRLVKQGLRKLPFKTECEFAYDGLQAGWRLSKVVPDLVILDLHLPKVDGYDVCKFLKSEPAFKKTKIIAISTHTPEKEVRILKLGADCFLSKPFSLVQLEKIVRQQLGWGSAVTVKGALANGV